jgi:lipoprotein-anchoring transpeptidase ErfK/SrfK
MMRCALVFALFLTLSGMAQQLPGQGLADMLMEYFHARYRDVEPSADMLYVSIERQRMYHLVGGNIAAEYPISTSARGLGAQNGSERTPEGLHRVVERVGTGVPAGGLFEQRVFAGRMGDPTKDTEQITSRILWLEGMEPGHNQGGEQDSYGRRIYIHGTPHERALGRPASHGCIRMADADIVYLYDRIPVGTMVVILDN